MADGKASYPIELDLYGNFVVTAPRGIHARLAEGYYKASGGAIFGDEGHDVIRVNPPLMPVIHFLADD